MFMSCLLLKRWDIVLKLRNLSKVNKWKAYFKDKEVNVYILFKCFASL